MRHRKVKVKKLAHVYTAIKWQSQDLNPGNMTVKLVLYISLNPLQSGPNLPFLLNLLSNLSMTSRKHFHNPLLI